MEFRFCSAFCGLPGITVVYTPKPVGLWPAFRPSEIVPFKTSAIPSGTAAAVTFFIPPSAGIPIRKPVCKTPGTIRALFPPGKTVFAAAETIPFFTETAFHSVFPVKTASGTASKITSAIPSAAFFTGTVGFSKSGRAFLECRPLKCPLFLRLILFT